MSDTSLIFNILAKDKASQVFNQFKLSATHAFDAISEKALDFAKESIAASEEGEKSQLLLSDAFAKFPKLADTNIESMKRLAEQIQSTTMFDHNAVQEGEAKLAMFNFTGRQIEALTPLMADFAAKTGGDMASAAMVFGKAMVGQGRGLKQVGINFKDLHDPTKNYIELQTLLNQKVGGFAEKQGKTAAGTTAIFKNEVEDLKEKLGDALIPVLMKLVPVLQTVLEFLSKHIDTVIKVATVLGAVIGIIWALNMAVRAYTIVQIALNLVMAANPVVLIVLAILALIAVFVILWIKVAPFRLFWIRLWHDHVKAVVDAKNWIVGAWDAMIGWFGRVGSRIGHALGSVGGIIGGIFKGALNGVVSYINFWIDGVDTIIHGINSISGVVGVPSIPDIPQVPKLDTGGTIMRTGIALVHRGETVVPAGRSGGGYATVIIDLRGDDEEMVRRLRKKIRVIGGRGPNSVQVALGQG